MAEIVRTETRTQKRHTSRTVGVSSTSGTTQITTTVRSVHGRDVSVIRDFVAALDAAEAPGTAYIEDQRDTVGHLTGLSAKWTTYPDPATPEEE